MIEPITEYGFSFRDELLCRWVDHLGPLYNFFNLDASCSDDITSLESKLLNSLSVLAVGNFAAVGELELAISW